MNFNIVKQISKQVSKGILGMTAAGTLAAGVVIKPWEGRFHQAYYDPIGVATVCDGITGDAVVFGKYYSDAECDALLAHEINEHEKRLDQCLKVELPVETKAALISFAFNVGTGAACKSTLVRKANAGDLVGACNQLSRWVYAGGRRFKGLENRRYRGDSSRISERTLCLVGIDPSYKTPLYERVYVNYRDWKSKIFKSEEI